MPYFAPQNNLLSGQQACFLLTCAYWSFLFSSDSRLSRYTPPTDMSHSTLHWYSDANFPLFSVRASDGAPQTLYWINSCLACRTSLYPSTIQ